MKILLTGATGYIGKRIIPLLVSKGHKVVCCVRDSARFNPPKSIENKLEVIEIDLLDKASLLAIPKDIDIAYYLVHSMAASKDYNSLESLSAQNFSHAISKTACKQVIYMGGIANKENLSDHLASRKNVELELAKGKYHLTTFRAGIIIGSGSASFEIIRDLVEKLPIMITPKWLNTKCQPISIIDALTYLTEAIGNTSTYDQVFDIGGPDILTYKQMLMKFAQVRKLKRKIVVVPIMTPRLSSYWLYFVTATSYKLATALVDSMKIEVICKDNRIKDIIPFECLGYTEALNRAFSKIDTHEIPSSWKDSFSSSQLTMNLSDFLSVPTHGCFFDQRQRKIDDPAKVIENIWQLGGSKGWYYANWLWHLRGAIDKLFGGVGLRRGRTNPDKIFAGDSIDFWRAIYANKQEGRLLLFAEMKLPGDAWLEFRIENNILIQTATFRPRGLNGRLYWYAVLPFHGFVFKGMINHLIQ